MRSTIQTHFTMELQPSLSLYTFSPLVGVLSLLRLTHENTGFLHHQTFLKSPNTTFTFFLEFLCLNWELAQLFILLIGPREPLNHTHTHTLSPSLHAQSLVLGRVFFCQPCKCYLLNANPKSFAPNHL